jgi:HK97 family phage prohead protease
MRGTILPTPPTIQYRTSAVRALDDDAAGFEGHASTFWRVDSYGTAMKKGAFKKTLAERGSRVPLLWQHDPWTPIGKPTELKEDRDGLAFRAEVVTDTRAGAEAMALLRADVPMGMSFGFETIKSRPVEDGDMDKLDWSDAPRWMRDNPEEREYARIIEEVKLWEISLVTFAANEAATISSVRHQQSLDYLSTLIESMRAGTLSDEQAAQIEQLAAAWQQRAGAGAGTPDPTPLPDETEARADREAYIRQLARSLGLTVEQMTCAV